MLSTPPHQERTKCLSQRLLSSSTLCTAMLPRVSSPCPVLSFFRSYPLQQSLRPSRPVSRLPVALPQSSSSFFSSRSRPTLLSKIPLHRVPETLSENILKLLQAPAKPDYPVIIPADLVNYDAFLFGVPTRYGSFPAQWKVVTAFIR